MLSQYFLSRYFERHIKLEWLHAFDFKVDRNIFDRNWRLFVIIFSLRKVASTLPCTLISILGLNFNNLNSSGLSLNFFNRIELDLLIGFVLAPEFLDPFIALFRSFGSLFLASRVYLAQKLLCYVSKLVG
jgi:hypothetical protein